MIKTKGRWIASGFLALVAAGLEVAFWHRSKPTEYVPANAPYVLSPEELEGLKKQASGGAATAAIRVAKYYDLVVLDKQTAIQWWELAANQGDTNAQFTSGLHLVDSANPTEAERGMKWLQLAASNGDKSAERLLEARKSKQSAGEATKP